MMTPPLSADELKTQTAKAMERQQVAMKPVIEECYAVLEGQITASGASAFSTLVSGFLPLYTGYIHSFQQQMVQRLLNEHVSVIGGKLREKLPDAVRMLDETARLLSEVSTQASEELEREGQRHWAELRAKTEEERFGEAVRMLLVGGQGELALVDVPEISGAESVADAASGSVTSKFVNPPPFCSLPDLKLPLLDLPGFSALLTPETPENRRFNNALQFGQMRIPQAVGSVQPRMIGKLREAQQRLQELVVKDMAVPSPKNA